MGGRVFDKAAPSARISGAREGGEGTIAVMDLAMPELNGLEATRKIRKLLPKTQVVILSLHYSDQPIREGFDSGVAEIRCQQRAFACHCEGQSLHRTRSIATGRDGSIALTSVFKGSIRFDGEQLVEDHPGDYCGFLAKLSKDGTTCEWQEDLMA